MGDALFNQEGEQIYSGRGRKPKDFWSRAESGEFFRNVDGELIQFWEGTEESSKEDEIKEYLAAQQHKQRDNCRTCKFFAIPVENWPHKKLWGECTKSKNETKASWDCKHFCRPGELTPEEEWKAVPKKQQKKIIAAEKKAKKAYNAIKKEMVEFDKKRWAHLFKIFDGEINADKVNRYTALLKKTFERVKNPELIKARREAAKVATINNRKKAAQFLGIKYRPKKKAFRWNKIEKRSLHSMVQAMEKAGENVASEFILGEGLKITKGDSVFGPCPV